MKKEMNLKSRRKWIMGGLAAFASVALLTTGFAVWVVGVQQNTKDGNVQVKVDTALNESLYFEMTLNDKDIVLAEDKEVTDGFVRATKSSEDGAVQIAANPLQISFENISIKYGKDSTLKPTKIQFSFSGDNAADVTTSVNKTKREGTSWNYIFAPIDLALPTSGDNTEAKKYEEDANGNVTITMSTVTVDFRWGDYFGNSESDPSKNDSPCTYYNSKYDKDTALYEDSVAIQEELKAMHDALDGKTIGLKATLVA